MDATPHRWLGPGTPKAVFSGSERYAASIEVTNLSKHEQLMLHEDGFPNGFMRARATMSSDFDLEVTGETRNGRAIENDKES